MIKMFKFLPHVARAIALAISPSLGGCLSHFGAYHFWQHWANKEKTNIEGFTINENLNLGILTIFTILTSNYVS